VRETDTTYDPAVGLPATVTTVMTPAATIVQTHIYDDTTGNVTDSVQPGGTAGGQGDRKTIYYGAGPNATYPQCGNHPEWANLTCDLPGLIG
jgi:hypothetical protein